MEPRRKAYVKVQAEFDILGNVTPQVIKWEDGTKYEIDRVLDRQRRASMRAGGIGLRYRVRVVWDTPGGRPACAVSYLFLEEDGRWFVEAKK